MPFHNSRQSMSTDRSAAIALVSGSAAGLVTMFAHPTGHEVVRNAAAGASNALTSGVHWLAIVGEALILTGALAITRRLRTRRDIAVGAYVFFALAGVAVIIAAAASGLLAPSIVDRLATADAPERASMMNALHYTGLLNQTFARVHVLFSGIAILLWSGAALGGRELSRPLAVFGLLFGAVLAAGVLSGYLRRLDIHSFGLVVVGQGAWMVWTATQLWRVPTVRAA